ncbi:MAG: glucosaminidase domain-containing protein [Acetatifactor muris]|nr:glucosaminidase domain-containing protein [Acetatifactor muris]MCM1525664.1 glucosaminidase domain-containing protein [Bacteroides sp.]
MRLAENFLVNNPCYVTGRKIAVKGLMFHSVGCPQPKASAFLSSWNRADFTGACVHGFIDALDGTVYQTLPWGYRGWHCGSGKNGSGNDTHIGVEMCEPSCIAYIGGAAFRVADGKLEEAAVCVRRTYQAAELKNLSETDVIAKVEVLFTADQKKSGIPASVSLAQFILESGYGKSELAQNANNVFGMKKNLSGNIWDGSAWDGVSVYTKQTQEYIDGKYVAVTADFRKYLCVEDSIADHSAYLLGAMDGEKLRYEGLKGCMDYRKAVQIVKDGGYATSPDYVEKLCSIIERWGLVKYDVEASGGEDAGKKYYRVRKAWADAGSQKGAFTVLDNAKKCADGKPGYAVFDWNGEQVYPQRAEAGGMTDEDCPFLVRVGIPDLNIRKGSGTDTAKTGKVTGKGIFTITEVRQGKGSEKGWGRLKSGTGWIALDFCERV